MTVTNHVYNATRDLVLRALMEETGECRQCAEATQAHERRVPVGGGWELAAATNSDAVAQAWDRSAPSAEATLAAVDAAVEGRCAGPDCESLLTPDSMSAYFCGLECQEAWSRQQAHEPDQVRGSEGVDPSEMRWRPDLVSAFDDPDLELLREQAGDAERTYRWYRHRDGRRFLRLDDGHRWVGAFCDLADGLRVDLWHRLERELTDRSRIDDRTVPPSPIRGDVFQIRIDHGWWVYNLAAPGVEEQLQQWMRANAVAPEDVVWQSAHHAVWDRSEDIRLDWLRLECHVRDAGGRCLAYDEAGEIQTVIRSVPLVKPLPEVLSSEPYVQADDRLGARSGS